MNKKGGLITEIDFLKGYNIRYSEEDIKKLAK